MNAEMSLLEMGLFLLIAGMAVVFSALLVLMFALKLLGRIEQAQAARKAAAAAAVAAPAIAAVEPDASGVLVAAIATTLLLDAQHLEDEERMVLTLRALPKPYSNWWQSRLARGEIWRPRTTNTRAEALRASQPQN